MIPKESPKIEWVRMEEFPKPLDKKKAYLAFDEKWGIGFLFVKKVQYMFGESWDVDWSFKPVSSFSEGGGYPPGPYVYIATFPDHNSDQETK